MPFQGVFADWPTGTDFESSTPVLWPTIDRKLAQLGSIVQSEAERKETIPNPAANERWTVRCPPLNLTWTWDGKRWLTWDDSPVDYPAYWYDGSDDTPLHVGTGLMSATYQRRGYWCDMTLVTVLGDNGDQGAGGGEKWYWFFQFPPLDMYQTGTARVRLADTREYPCTVGFMNNSRIYIAYNGQRVNKDVVPWDTTKGNQINIQMTYRLKV